MEVIGYQLLIVVSLMLVRIVSPNNLLTVCYVWTGFTVLNLFYWPLIFIQLFVVWGTYGLINSNDDKRNKNNDRSALPGSTAAGKIKKSTEFEDSTKKSEAESGGLNKIIDMVQQINDYVDTAAVIQKATANVRSQMATEKTLIDAAINSARRKVDIEKMKLTPEERVVFDATLLETKRAMEAEAGSARSSAKNTIQIRYEVPNFEINVINEKADVAEEIERNFRSLASFRDEYIATVVNDLKSDSQLAKFFLAQLENFGVPVLCGFFRAKLPGHFLHSKKTTDDLPVRISHIKGKFGLMEIPDSMDIGKGQPEKIAVQPDIDIKPEPADIPAKTESHQSEKQTDEMGFDGVVGENPLSYLSLLSFPTPKNKERLRIKSTAWSRKIPYLVHFTRAVNLPTIMVHGICSVEKSREIGLFPSVNDEFRMDGYLNATSFSISFPNSRMFYKYRMLNPSEEWVVLIVRPQVLWDKDNAFCSFNAADARVTKCSLSELSSPSAFEQMFEECEGDESRVNQGLMACEPTDVQAEVLVFESVEPNMIAELVFDDEKVWSKYRACIGNKTSRIHRKNRGMFASRKYFIRSRKNA